MYLLLTVTLRHPGGHELAADYWELVGSSPAGGAENLVNEESHIDVQLDQRHMMLRGDTVRERGRGVGGGRGGGVREGRGKKKGTGWIQLLATQCLLFHLQLSKIFRIRSTVTQW